MKKPFLNEDLLLFLIGYAVGLFVGGLIFLIFVA